jgi:hypothetical protein
MEEKSGSVPPQSEGVSSPARGRLSFLQNIRSVSQPLPKSPRLDENAASAQQSQSKHAHDSLRPPFWRPSSIIPTKAANQEYVGEISLPEGDKLATFRRLIGIDSSPTHTVGGGYHRPAENVGLYTRVVYNEINCQVKYKRFAIIINASLGLQLIFSAAVTAVGAGDGPRAGITALGALNTVSSLLQAPLDF